MEIEYLSSKNQQAWNHFALSSDMAWFRHTTYWMDYSASCRFDSNAKNLSFLVKQGKDILAIVPLLAEYDYHHPSTDIFAMYGDYTPLPALQNSGEISPKKILTTIHEEIQRLIEQYHIVGGKFVIDPLIQVDYAHQFQLFDIFPVKATPQFQTTNVVNLSLDETTILHNMRHGHKAAVKSILKEKNYHVEIFDSTNITFDKLLTFKKIHKIDAGRQTRTDKSWEHMYQWIKNGNAILALLWLEDMQQYISGSLIMIYKNAAYYASYAILDSSLLFGLSGYALQWAIIKYLKSFLTSGGGGYTSMK